jgi:hypothetical protein
MKTIEIQLFKKQLNAFFRNLSKILNMIVLSSLWLFAISSCESGDNIAEKSEIYNKLIEELDRDPNNFNACLDIVNEYEDTLTNQELDSSLAKLLMERFTDEEIVYNLEGSNVKITGILKNCLAVNSAEIRFEEHEESLTERNLLRLLESNVYPIVEVILKCRIINEFSNEGYAHSFDYKVELKDFSNQKISDLGVFKIKSEDILDHLFPGGFNESEVNTEREIKLRFKLWDDKEAEDEEKKILGRTKMIFIVLNTLKNIENLNIELKLNELPEDEMAPGETVHTGPRGGKYVIRNGSKRYQ